MPRVSRDAEVTVVILVYRSMRWLEWCMDGIERSEEATRYRYLVVANDCTGEVLSELQSADFDWIDFRNPNPEEFYINRVYRAWNHGVVNAPTPWVVMLNSDMYPAHGWLDQLMQVKRRGRTPGREGQQVVPTSLLVESGRIPSAMPAYCVKNLGLNPEEFQRDRFLSIAKTLRDDRQAQVAAGTLYMPILVDRQEFIDVGKYPDGNPPGTTGDKDLIGRYEQADFRHVMVLGSVLYHCQEGEQRWP